jgi:hypothetical protein
MKTSRSRELGGVGTEDEDAHQEHAQRDAGLVQHAAARVKTPLKKTNKILIATFEGLREILAVSSRLNKKSFGQKNISLETFLT